MMRRGPLATLLVVAGLAFVLLLVNTTTQAGTRGAGDTAQPTTVAPPGTEAPPPPPPGTPPPGAPPPGAPPEQGAPPPPAEQGEISYAGRTSGNEATVAIAVQGDRAMAYVCDGERVEAWLEGGAAGGQLSLEGDGATLTGAVQGEAVFGSVAVGPRQWPFSAQVAGPPAGLYEGRGTVGGEPARVGWIVLQDGSQVGVSNVGGERAPAPRLDPTQLGDVRLDGAPLDTQRVGG